MANTGPKTTGNVARMALRQQIDADRLFGVRSVPLVLPPQDRGSHASASQDDPQALIAKTDLLRVLDQTQVRDCTKCTLSTTRTQTVFGQGNPNARLVFVGEAPGFDEDKQGLAFVGRAGQLLTRMIVAGMGLRRDDVFICNVLKCRPPNNRDPSADEILACQGYLHQQLSIIDPEVIVALGAPAAKTLLETTEGIGRLRGRFHDYDLSTDENEGRRIALMPTYHPAYLERVPSEKGKTWDDLKMVMEQLGLPNPQER